MTDAHMMARISDPNTSHEAAHSFNPTRMEAMILEAIAKFPDGCIADNIRMLFPHIRRHTIVPRFAPLLRSGCIVDTGERRKAASGRKQRVVKFVPEPERVAGFQKPKKIKWVGLTEEDRDAMRTAMVFICHLNSKGWILDELQPAKEEVLELLSERLKQNEIRNP